MIRVTVNTSRINHRLQGLLQQVYPMVKQQICKGSTPYCPYLTGDLQRSAQPSSVDPTPYLIYNIVYARYQYYANGMAPADFAGRTKNVHPLAQCLWVDTYLNSGGRRDIALLCNHPDRYLRF